MRKIGEQNIRKIQQSHGTYYVSLPISVVREMKLREKQLLTVEYDKQYKRIIIKDWKPKKKK